MILRSYGDPAGQLTPLAAAADRLRIDAATAEALGAFRAAGVEALVLKGPSLTGWLYTTDDAVTYIDSDLLLRPGDEQTASEVLTELGFERLLDDSRWPDWQRWHEAAWGRDRDSVRLELHRWLIGIGADADTAWMVLAGSTETIPVAGIQAPALAPPARLLHVVLHAAQHGEAGGKAIAHVERALARFDESLWREAARLAKRLGAIDAFAAGLRLRPEGAALADRLGLPHELPTDVALRAGTPPPVALGLAQLERAENLRARLAILRHKLVPPPSLVRHRSPRARKGRLGLALAYFWRPLWLLARLPAGFKAWRSARRRAQRSGSNSR